MRIDLVSSWAREDDGWDIATRLHARAMRMGGIDVRLVSDGRDGVKPTAAVLDEVEGVVGAPRESDLTVLSYQLMNAPLTARKLFEYQPHAMHAVFETVDVDPGVVRLLSKLKVVWAQCKANAGALAAAGVQNVVHLPVPWLASDPLCGVPAPTRSDRFLYVGRAELRKAPDRLVRAFCAAFKPGEATLTIKLSRWRNPAPYPDPEAIAAELGRTDIQFIRGRLSREQMVELYASHDVYCSASRGEGWDLCAYAAKLAGRRYAGTDSGGVMDYLSEEDVIVPQSGITVAPAWFGGSLRDHDFDALVAALQTARGLPNPPKTRLPERLRIDRVAEAHREFWPSLTRV